MLEMFRPCVTLVYLQYIFKFQVDQARDNKDIDMMTKAFHSQ